MRQVEWDFLQRHPEALKSPAKAEAAIAELTSGNEEIRADLVVMENLRERLIKFANSRGPIEPPRAKPSGPVSRREAALARLQGRDPHAPREADPGDDAPQPGSASAHDTLMTLHAPAESGDSERRPSAAERRAALSQL